MKKIIASTTKLDQLLKKRNEQKELYKSSVANKNEEQKQYERALNEVIDKSMKEIESMLSKFDLLKFEALGIGGGRTEIFAQEAGVSKKDALKWSITIDASPSKGHRTYTSASWSKLSELSSEKLDVMQQSVDAMRMLNDMDWQTFFSKFNYPRREDYVHTELADPPYIYDAEINVETMKMMKQSNTLLVNTHGYRNYNLYFVKNVNSDSIDFLRVNNIKQREFPTVSDLYKHAAEVNDIDNESVTNSYFFDYLEPITEVEYESILDGQKIWNKKK